MLLYLAAGLAFAQPLITPPSVGVVRDSDGGIRVVLGTAGHFLLVDAVMQGAISAAFSGVAGLVKTGSEVLVLDAKFNITARYPAPSGPAVFAFTDTGTPAYASFPSTAEALQFGDGGVPIPSTDGQDIVAPDGRRIHVDFKVDAFEQMSPHWFAVREARGRIFALRLDKKELVLYQLPETVP
ncbi:MAG TPA: hypothetical protein VKU01_14725 [Bryobacteraceae bacterium]|nr:hypothetical protein [Bryobacteraceae bacterium]